MRYSLIISTIFLLSLFVAPTMFAAELPDFVVKAVAQVSVYNEMPFDEDNLIQQGSGVFVDHGGCLYTNSHVVLDFWNDDQAFQFIQISITEDRALAPKQVFEAEVVYVDQALDLAYLCPKYPNATPKLFTHFFERFKTSQFETVPFGEEIWLMGYPYAGESSITIAPGHVVGFIKNPKIEDWLGVPDLDPDLLSLYKTDALSGPGVSGGLMVDSNLRLLGVPFAGSQLPGAFVFSLSDAVYQQFERDVRMHLHREGLVPSDCVFDMETDYYYQASQRFYDNQCTMEYDESMEHEVSSTYQAFCDEEISSQRLVPAIRRSKEFGDLGAWSDNMVLMCTGIS